MKRKRKPGNSGELTPTPAMMAGLVPDLWDIERLYDEVTALERDRKQMEKYRRLAAKLREQH